MNCEIENILQNFPIDVNSTKQVTIKGLKQDTRLYKVTPKQSNLLPKAVNIGNPLIIDSISGMKIACHPHIVGNTLEKLSLDCALEFMKCIKKMRLMNKNSSAVLHILRGALGYKLVEALKKNIPIISIHPKYQNGGYRSHIDHTDNISIIYRDYPTTQFSEEISNLIIPDTYATGRSAETAIKDILQTGMKIKNIVLYGFISIPSLIKIAELTNKNKIKLTSFAIGNLTLLSYNNYDMPLYGLDESSFMAINQLNRLGSIVALQTLKRYLPNYVAGLDQPGDWSERQNLLYNGSFYEKGDIKNHLKKSTSLIKSLSKINSKQSWFNKFHKNIAIKELFELKKRLETN